MKVMRWTSQPPTDQINPIQAGCLLKARENGGPKSKSWYMGNEVRPRPYGMSGLHMITNLITHSHCVKKLWSYDTSVTRTKFKKYRKRYYASIRISCRCIIIVLSKSNKETNGKKKVQEKSIHAINAHCIISEATAVFSMSKYWPPVAVNWRYSRATWNELVA